MTRVRFEDRGGRYVLSARGHATYEQAPPGAPRREGEDRLTQIRVCAAVSGLLCALAGYLELEEGAGENGRRMDGADVLLDYSGGGRVEAAYAVAMVGLRQLQQAYPELVEVTVWEKK